MKTVKLMVKSEAKASPKEAVIRIIYSMLLAFVLGLLKMAAGIIAVLQWLHIIFTSKRHKGMNEIIRFYVDYQAKATAYAFMATDERPEILP